MDSVGLRGRMLCGELPAEWARGGGWDNSVGPTAIALLRRDVLRPDLTRTCVARRVVRVVSEGDGARTLRASASMRAFLSQQWDEVVLLAQRGSPKSGAAPGPGDGGCGSRVVATSAAQMVYDRAADISKLRRTTHPMYLVPRDTYVRGQWAILATLVCFSLVWGCRRDVLEPWGPSGPLTTAREL